MLYSLPFGFVTPCYLITRIIVYSACMLATGLVLTKTGYRGNRVGGGKTSSLLFIAVAVQYLLDL